MNAGLGELEEGFGLGVGELDDIFEERIRSDGAGRDGGLPEDLLPPADGAGFRFAVILASALLSVVLRESSACWGANRVPLHFPTACIRLSHRPLARAGRLP